jgi:hypothetical protein
VVKSFGKIALFSAGFSVLLQSLSYAGSFVTSAKPSCSEVVISVKGRINYKDSMKSGDLGFHHCLHRKLRSADFPKVAPASTYCAQVDMEPEVVGINPPLPHDGNAEMPVFQRPNPYYIPDGTACEVKYAQYYYQR